MTAALDRCTAALGNANVRAFLRVIREGESSQDDSAYTVLNGGGHFRAPPWRHPYHGVPTTQGGRAAGAYQFLGTTWARVAERLGLGDDFSPASQDAGAVYLIEGRGALPAVMEGNLVLACSQLADEWISLPALKYDRVLHTFLGFGGTQHPAAQDRAGEPIPAPDVSTPPEPAPSAPAPDLAPPRTNGGFMAPLMFLPAILEMVPSLIGLFGKGERGQQNAQAAQIVVDAFRAAVPGAINAQDAIERAQTDPAIRAAAKASVMADPAILGLIEVGGGVVKARDANLALVATADRWWKLVLNPVFLVTLLTLPLIYIIVLELVKFMSKVSPDVIAQTIGTIVGLVLGSIMGFWMGQTYTQSRTGNNQRASDQPLQ